jgi:hypothetical protein
VTLIRDARAAMQELRANPEDPQYPLTSSVLVDLFAGSKTHAGVHVSESQRPQGRRGVPGVVAAGVTIGSLPLQTFIAVSRPVVSGGPATRPACWRIRAAATGVRHRHAGHPVGDGVLRNAVVHLLTWGNAYIVRCRTWRGPAWWRWTCSLPNRVQPRWGRRTNGQPVGKYFYVLGENGQPDEATPATSSTSGRWARIYCRASRRSARPGRPWACRWPRRSTGRDCSALGR